jgi:hypothetical protein
MGGMITATVLAIFFVPVFFVVQCAAALAAEVTMLSTAIRLSNTDSHE